MAAGGDHPDANKRKREAAGRSKAPSKGATKRSKTYGAPAAKAEPQPVTAKDKRVAAKEMSESRKMKRKPNYNLEKELAVLWEKMRCDVSKENRSKLVTKALRKMDGKYFEIAGSHVTARVLQTCVKWCSQPERDAVFVALQPHLLHLSHKKYAVFLVKKLIKTRLLETISKLGLHKSSVLQYMATVIQPVLEKGIVEYAIVHVVILEYLTIADKTSALDVIRQLIPHLTQGSSVVDGDELSGVAEVPTKSKAKKKRSSEPFLIRIMQTREGLKLGLACLKHGSRRKKIIKSLKGQVMKLALSYYGCLFLACLLSIVDDTKLVTKVVIEELTKQLKELIFDKNGRRPLLQLLHPLCSRYLTPTDLICLKYRVPSLISKDEASESAINVNLDSKLDDVAEKNIGVQKTHWLHLIARRTHLNGGKNCW
ncbi:hypothetical protein VPH35_071098 [Triticum aestivum]